MLDHPLPHPALSAAAAADPAAERPLLLRVRDTFLAPARLGAALRDAPTWRGALALLVAAAMLLVLAVPTDVFVGFTEGATDRLGRPVEVTSSPETIGLYGRLLGMMSALTYQPLFALALAGVLALVFSVLLRGGAEFRHYFALAAHALLIPAFGGIVLLAVRLLGGEGLVRFYPGPLLQGGMVGHLFGGINLLTVWMLAVAGIGASVLNDGRPSRSVASGLLIGGYVVLSIAVGLLTY